MPYPNPQQLVGLGEWRNQKGEGYIQTGVSEPNLNDIAQTGIFQQVGYYRWSPFNITESSHPESVDGIAASAGLLSMFGIAPELGRYISPDETLEGRDPGCHPWPPFVADALRFGPIHCGVKAFALMKSNTPS